MYWLLCDMKTSWEGEKDLGGDYSLMPKMISSLRLLLLVLTRGGLASRATGLGPEGPPSARVPMGPFCAGRKIFQMVNFG